MNDFNQSIAVVIGINAYQEGIAALATPVQDAQELVRILHEQHGYKTYLFLDQAATHGSLIELLTSKLPSLVGKNDRVLFYFAGHGIALNGEDGPEGYLVPQDARLGEVQTYLSMTQVNKALLQLSCRHFLGILDCCFAGAFRWSSTRKLIPIDSNILHQERFDRFIHDPAWQMITSAAYDQTALDAFDLKDDRGQKGKHSPFAAALVEAFQGSADAYPPAQLGKPAGDGVLTATELYLYLRDRVETMTEGCAIRQTPGIYPLSKHDKGEYIFLVPGRELNLPPAPALDVSKNPYRGLESFEEEHCPLFFGRKALTQRLSEFVAHHSLTIVLGASGSGKSSLVKAGLIPKLRQLKGDQSWHILPPFRPGESPFVALNKALESVQRSPIALPHDTTSNCHTPAQGLAHWFGEHPQTQLLIAVDQFEELITLCRNEQERQCFLEGLAAAIAAYPDRLHVVLTLRSDFEPQFRNTVLENDWQKGRFIVPAMTREELREAIEQPASARVMYFNPHELVDQLIDEVANMPGALPLLSFALSELYLKYLKRQEAARNRGETLDRAMTQADYDELGGVTRSITQRANEEYQTLKEQDTAYAETVRNVMLRMISLQGGKLTRRSIPKSELVYADAAENDRVRTVIQRFSETRLIVENCDDRGKPYIEPAHDALVQGWDRLLAWKQEEEENLILQQRLTPAAIEWRNISSTEQPRTSLAKLSASLEQASFAAIKKIQSWQQRGKHRNHKNLRQTSEATAKAFLWNNDPRLRQVEELLDRDPSRFNEVETDFVRRSEIERRKRIYLGRTLVAVIIAGLSGLTLYAVSRQREALINQMNAYTQSSEALLTTQPVNATVNAIAALGMSKTPLIYASGYHVPVAAHNSLLQSVQTLHEKYALQHEGVIYVGISTDSKTIISGSGNGTVQLWDINTGKSKKQLLNINENVASVAVSSDSKLVVSGGTDDSSLKIWNAITGFQEGQPLRGYEYDEARVDFVAISTNGKTIASSSHSAGRGRETVRLWDSTTGVMKRQFFPGDQGHRAPIAISSDGKTIVSGNIGGIVQVWDVTKGTPKRKPLRSRGSDITSIAISHDGSMIVSGNADGTIEVWDNTSDKGKSLRGHESSVTSIAISHDGSMIVSGSADGTMKMWSSDSTIDTMDRWSKSETEEILLRGHQGSVESIAISLDGKTIVSGSASDGTVRVWNRASLLQGKPLNVQSSQLTSQSISISGDGKTIVSIGSGNNILLWNMWNSTAGIRIRQLLHDYESETVDLVNIRTDGKVITSASDKGTVRLWDIDPEITNEQLIDIDQNTFGPIIAVSTDSTSLITSDSDNTAWLWTVKARVPQKQLFQNSRVLAISPDGRTIINGRWDGNIEFWDTVTRKLKRQHITLRGGISAVAVSADGETFISGGEDDRVRLWDSTGAPLGQALRVYQRGVTAIAISNGGKAVITMGQDETVKLWDMSWENLLNITCQHLRYHSILVRPETKIAKQARDTCKSYAY